MPRQIEENIAIRRHRSVSYAKWGYLFIAPFFIVYILCTLIPQFLTVYNSFFESYMDGLKQVGPNYVGIKNYIALFTPDSRSHRKIKYTQKLIIWILGNYRSLL